MLRILLAASLLATLVVAAAPVIAQPVLPDATPIAADSERVSRSEIIERALSANYELQNARLAVERAAYERQRALGRRDVSLTSELSLSRSATPVNSGISSGLSRSDQIQLDTTALRRFDTGTSLSLNYTNAYRRTEFPLVIGGVVTDTIVNGPDYLNALTLSVTQSLLRGRQRAVERSADVSAELQRVLAEAQLEATHVQIQSDALVAFANAVVAEAAVELQVRSLERTERQLTIAQSRLAAGQIAPFELNLLRQRLATNREAMLVASADLRRVSRQLMQLTQRSPSARFVLPDGGLRADPELPEMVDICRSAADFSPQVRIASLQVELAEQSVIPARDQRRPQLDLTIGATTTGLDPDFLQSIEEMATLDALTMFGTLRISALVGDRAARAQIGQSEIDVTTARRSEEQARDAVCFAVLDAAETFELQQRRVRFADYRVQIAAEALDAEQARFERGLSTVQLILDALDNQENAELEALRARAELELAWIALLRQVGDLDRVAEGR